MNSQQLLLRLRGMVRIEVRGSSIERFLNLCSRHDITLRQMDRIEAGRLRATLTVRDFRSLRGVMGRTGCRVHLIGRRGAPFAVHRFRKRYVLYGGVLLLAALFFVLSNFIWVVEHTLHEGVSGRALTRELSAMGVRVGAPMASLDADALQDALLVRLPELAHVAINRFGNRLEIEAYARAPTPAIVDRALPTDVVATRAGVITEMEVYEGAALKKVGETVAFGEELVSALMLPNTEGGEARLVHARADVTARTWYEQAARRPTEVSVKTYTGKTRTQYALIFGKYRVNLYFGCGISDGTCDKIVSESKIALTDDLELPIRLVRQTYRYYETAPFAPAAEDLRAAMTQGALARLEASISGTVAAQSTVLRALTGGAELTLYAECLEQIGMERVSSKQIPAPEPAEGERNP